MEVCGRCGDGAGDGAGVTGALCERMGTAKGTVVVIGGSPGLLVLVLLFDLEGEGEALLVFPADRILPFLTYLDRMRDLATKCGCCCC